MWHTLEPSRKLSGPALTTFPCKSLNAEPLLLQLPTAYRSGKHLASTALTLLASSFLCSVVRDLASFGLSQKAASPTVSAELVKRQLQLSGPVQVADPFSTLVNHFVDQGFSREEVSLALAAQKGRLEGQDAQVSFYV